MTKVVPVDMLEAALAYAREEGWPVVPLHTPLANGQCSCRKATCDSVGKHPRNSNGLTGATIDQATITKWWTKWPNANIGIATGEASFVVLDVDLPDGPASLAELEAKHGPLPPTLEARTGGGGRHIAFEHPGVKIGNVQKNDKKLGKNLDVRGDGGYIVVHPSLHESGKHYGRLNGAALAPVPKWMIDALSSKTAKKPEATAHQTNAAVIPEGERNRTLASLAGSMRSQGMDAEEIAAALIVTNTKRCQPQLSEAEVQRIAWSISRYEANADLRTGLPQDREDALRYIRDTLGLGKLEELPKRGETYEMKVAEKLFPVGDVNSLMSHRLLRNAVYDALGVVIPKFKPAEYDRLMRAWAIAKTDVATVTDDEVTLGWLSGYRDHCFWREVVDLDSSDPEIREIAVAAIIRLRAQSGRANYDNTSSGGFVAAARWYVRLESLKRFVMMDYDTFVTEKELAKRLSRLGFYRRQIERTDSDGTRARALVWISPPKFEAD